MNENPAICSCTNNGNPWLLNGELVVSRNLACRVHQTVLSPTVIPLKEERVVETWVGREKE